MDINRIRIFKEDRAVESDNANPGCENVTITTQPQEAFKEFFNKRVRAFNKDHKDDDGLKITRNYIAEQLGYSDPVAKGRAAKIITNNLNEKVRTTNRDRMIAIFIVCGFSVEDASHALELYGMPGLRTGDTKDNIVRIGLERHETYKTICQQLKAVTGLPLQIKDEKSSTTAKNISTNFEVLSDQIHYGDFVGNRSLEGLYDPEALAFTEEIELKDHDGNIYRLRNDEGSYYIDYEYAEGGYDHQWGIDLDKCYLPDVPALFVESTGRLLKKRKETLAVLNDTRNYIIRYDISVRNGQIETFVESFDYDYPEQMRYFQLTRSTNTFQLTVTHSSVFLYHHLQQDRYKKFFGKVPLAEPIENYTAQGTIISKYDKKVYDRMAVSVRQLLVDIGSGEVIIADPYIDYDTDLGRSLTHFYGIKDKFSWIPDDSDGEYYPETWECTVDVNGKPFTISFELLLEAYQKGIKTIGDLYTIIQNYGSIEQFYRRQAELLFP